MADELLGGVVDGGENIQGEVQTETEISKPEPTPEDVALSEEEVHLPSDDEFVIPEKFEGKTAEEIARAYVELEKMKAKGGDEDAKRTESSEEKNETQASEKNPSEEVDSSKLYQEFVDNGDLSEDTYKMLEEKGYKRNEIKDRLEFEQYKQKKVIDELVEPIGGIDNYTKMSEWFESAIPDADRQAISQELKASGKLAKQAIIKDLYRQYQASTGEQEDSIIHTNESQQKAGRGYNSQHELQADMSDPRYGIDRSYTQAVEEKMAKSNLEKL